MKYLNTFRINDSAVEIILSDFMPFIDDDTKKLIDNISHLKTKKMDFQCLALLLYANLLNSGIIEDDANRLQPILVGDESAIKEQLKSKPKYANYTDEQLNNKIKEIILKDTRNCLAHGLFELLPHKNIPQSLFVLENPRSEITVEHCIVISFDSIHNEIGKELQKVDFMGNPLSEHSLKEVKKALKTSVEKDKDFIQDLINTHTQNIIIPTNIEKMIDYYYNYLMGTKINKKVFDNAIFLKLMFIIKSAMFAYDQNDYHKIFGDKFDEVLKMIALIRNSFIHGNNEYENLNVKLKDNYKNNSPRIAETDFIKLGILMDCISQYRRMLDLKNLDQNYSTVDQKLQEISLSTSFDELYKTLKEITKLNMDHLEKNS